MIVFVNGEPTELPAEATVAALVAELAGCANEGRGIAVAVDGEVVPRTGWGERSLYGGNTVEVLVAVQGG